ncbi:hypothetical protein A2U01_0046702, partial [Trifolium medium]|nr:hypothetical protein [Trifolium medium]
KESFIERFIPEKMYINGDAGDGKLEACRKIGGSYRKVKLMRERDYRNER